MSIPPETPDPSNRPPEEKIRIKFGHFVFEIDNPRSKPFILLLTTIVFIFILALAFLLPGIMFGWWRK